jgi:hypothetical protein
MMNYRLHNKKNISKIITECKILDRTHLILDILHNVPKLLCKNAGGTGAVPIFIASTFWNVDSPRASRGNWNAWTWGNGD